MRNKVSAGRREDGQQTVSLQLEKGLHGQCVSVVPGASVESPDFRLWRQAARS